ncbi:coiled-coil domain-containing protein 74A-like isoform X1 [Branchiostoma lanceolatum]|uniref:coiled-coil domain-containing protein 74A-like isoform X1 n=1 Tax=Branchiostoma lanceolatum TaxID=7740 RepID=UPI0011332A12
MSSLAANSSTSGLPPLQAQFPQWSRVGTLDKARYPRPFLRDRLQTLPPPGSQHDDRGDRQGSAGRVQFSPESTDSDLFGTGDMDANSRAQHLQKSMNFLKQQHGDVLKSLHDEIEGLKRENKDLHFKLIMSKGLSPKKASIVPELSSVSSTEDQSSTTKEDKLDELKTLFLEEEIRDLKYALREARSRNQYLTQIIQQSGRQQLQQVQVPQVPPADHAYQVHGNAQVQAVHTDSSQLASSQLREMVKTPQILLNPLQIVPAPGQPPRPPTLAECELIIKYLQNKGDRQSHELLRLKSDLRDVLYSHKWTPDAYLLAKAYVADDKSSEGEVESVAKLPKVPMKNPTKKLPEAAFRETEKVSLPALKSTLGNKNVERRKRVQAAQKSRLRKEVLQ